MRHFCCIKINDHSFTLHHSKSSTDELAGAKQLSRGDTHYLTSALRKPTLGAILAKFTTVCAGLLNETLSSTSGEVLG